MFSKRVVYKDIEPWPGYSFDVEAIVHWGRDSGVYCTVRHASSADESWSMTDLRKLPSLTTALHDAVLKRFKVENTW
jgi:hypothetical protein